MHSDQFLASINLHHYARQPSSGSLESILACHVDDGHDKAESKTRRRPINKNSSSQRSLWKAAEDKSLEPKPPATTGARSKKERRGVSRKSVLQSARRSSKQAAQERTQRRTVEASNEKVATKLKKAFLLKDCNKD